MIFEGKFWTLNENNCLGEWVASKWKDLVDMFQKKDKSGTGGQTIEEKMAS